MEAFKKFLSELALKLRGVVLSRKFWALAAALIGIGDQLAAGAITPFQALQLAVAALGAYTVATAYEDGHRAQPQA